MKLNALALAGALAVLSGWAQAQAIDPLQVRSWASACASCHGTQGVAQAGNESLAGANKDDMLKKLLDFKTGKNRQPSCTSSPRVTPMSSLLHWPPISRL